jgi:hypothetical protein
MVGEPGKTVTRSLSSRPIALAGKAKFLYRTTAPPNHEGFEQLVEPIAVLQGKQAQDDIVMGVVEVVDRHAGRRNDVGMRNHHSLGLASRPRGVNQRRKIDVNRLASWALGRKVRNIARLRRGGRAFHQ